MGTFLLSYKGTFSKSRDIPIFGIFAERMGPVGFEPTTKRL